MSDIKEAELIQQGEKAEELLNNETFSTVTNKLVEAAFQAFVNSKPEDTKERERSYYAYRGLVDIHQTLQQSVAVKDNIMNRDNNEEVGLR